MIQDNNDETLAALHGRAIHMKLDPIHGPSPSPALRPYSSHWGAFSAAWHKGKLTVQAHPRDPDPNNPLIANFAAALHQTARGAEHHGASRSYACTPWNPGEGPS